MIVGMKQIKMAAAVAIIGIGAAVVLPMYASHASKEGEAKAGELVGNPFPASAVQAAEPAIDTAKQIALSTPAGQVAQAVAPVAVPVAIEAVKAVAPAITRAITPKPIRKEPRFETVTKRVCEPRMVTVEVDIPDQVKPVERNVLGMVLGGAAGALLGNQIGGGNGKTIATLAGAAGGAFAGDKMANSNTPQAQTTHKEQRTSTVEVCHDVVSQVRVN